MRIGRRELALMRDGSRLINTARSWLIDGDALLAELKTGRISAALDVYDTEPLPANHPLLQTPNTVLTPHVGISTDANYAVYYRDAAENVLAWLAGAPIRVVDGKRPTTGAWSAS